MPDLDIRDGELDQFSHALRDLSDSLFGYTDSNGKEHTGAYDQAQAEYNKALAEYETTKAAYDKKRATQIPDDVHKDRAAYDDTELTEARKKMEKAKEAYDDLAAIRNETNNSERRKAGRAETYLLDFNYDNKYERTSAIVSSGKALPMMAPGTVDNVVMFNSPGSGVRNIDAYGLPEGHVYESSIPDGDAVQGLGPDASYGTNPRKLEGITHLSADATDAANYWRRLPRVSQELRGSSNARFTASTTTWRTSKRARAPRRTSPTSSPAPSRQPTRSGRPSRRRAATPSRRPTTSRSGGSRRSSDTSANADTFRTTICASPRLSRIVV